MSPKPVVNVACPCCGERLEIDVATERVVGRKPGPKAGAEASKIDPLEAAMRGKAPAAAKDQFSAATEKVKREGADELDRLLKDARKKVRDKGDDFDDSAIKPRWD